MKIARQCWQVECTWSYTIRRELIIKSLGLSQLVYSTRLFSFKPVPQEISLITKTKLFNFLWKKIKIKIKRVGLYQDQKKGGICMSDIETMIKALRLACIPRLLTPEIREENWRFELSFKMQLRCKIYL